MELARFARSFLLHLLETSACASIVFFRSTLDIMLYPMLYDNLFNMDFFKFHDINKPYYGAQHFQLCMRTATGAHPG